MDPQLNTPPEQQTNISPAEQPLPPTGVPPVDPTEPQHPATPNLEQKRRKNKKVLVIVILLLALVIAAAAYFLFFKKDKETPVTQNTESSQTEQTNTDNTVASKKLNEVYYFYAEIPEGPYTLYRRPANGGERVEVKKFGANEYPYVMARNDSSFVFSVNSQLWLGKYDGQQPKKISEFDENIFLPSAVFNDNGSFYVTATSDPKQDDKSIIYYFDKDGGSKKSVFAHKGDSNALYILGAGSGKLALLESCSQCDGRNPINTTKTLTLSNSNYADSSPFDYFTDFYPSFKIMDDYKTIFFFKPTVDKSTIVNSDIGGPEHYSGGPYALTKLDADTKTETVLLGNLGEKETQKIEGEIYYSLGSAKGFFDQGADTASYFKNKVYLPTQTSLSTLQEFPSNEQIRFPIYASAEEILVGYGKRDGDSATQVDIPIYYIDLATKKSTEIMKAPDRTTLFAGVSFK